MKNRGVSKSALTITLSLLAFTGGSASAQVLYDNGSGALGTPGVGDYADASNTLGPDNGQYLTMAGDVFTATTSGTAYSITFAGIYYAGARPGAPTVDSFTVSLYSVSAGAPDTLITSTPVTDVSSYVAGLGRSRNVYEISGALSVPVTLTAGLQYYLGIGDVSGDDTNPQDDFAVGHTAASYASSNGYSYNSSTLSFQVSGSPLAFTLDVPEPSDAALLLLGLAGLFAARRWRARCQSR